MGGSIAATASLDKLLNVIATSLLDAFANALSFAFSVAVFVLVQSDSSDTAEIFS